MRRRRCHAAKGEELVIIGAEQNGYVNVQGGAGAGWVKKVLVIRRRITLVEHAMHYLLIYDLRGLSGEAGGFRSAHLKLAWEAQERGELVLGGPLGADGRRCSVQRGVSGSRERFADDPYVRNGLVKWRVRLWNTVVGEDAAAPLRPGDLDRSPQSPAARSAGRNVAPDGNLAAAVESRAARNIPSVLKSITSSPCAPHAMMPPLPPSAGMRVWINSRPPLPVTGCDIPPRSRCDERRRRG